LVATCSAISQTGQTVNVNGLDYFVAPTLMTIIDLSQDQISTVSKGATTDLIPLTVIQDSSNLFTTTVFESIISNFTATDDVFNTGFLQGTIILQI